MKLIETELIKYKEAVPTKEQIILFGKFWLDCWQTKNILNEVNNL